MSVALSMNKLQRMEALQRAWNTCVLCEMGKFANTHVFFRGELKTAQIVFIGEGPGREEDRQGKPFVGRSGELLNDAIYEARIPAEAYVIFNLVCCRPSEGVKAANRPPTMTEILKCAPRLYEMLKIVQPKTVALLGKVPSNAWNETRPLANVNVYHLHHPAYVLRQGGKQSEVYQETIQALIRIRKGTLQL